MAHMHEKIVSLISQNPSDRCDKDINLFIPWFQSMSALFKAQKTDVVKDILRNCEFRSLPADSIIIAQGEKGDSFYIILRGTVSIYINQTLEEHGNVKNNRIVGRPRGIQAKKENIYTSTPIGDSNDNNETGDHTLIETVDLNNNINEAEEGDEIDLEDDVFSSSECDVSEQGKLDRTLFGVHIRELGPGKSFGEIALVQTNSIRSASIITDQRTDLIVIDRELYNRSLKTSQKQEFQEKVDFVNSSPLFCKWIKRLRNVMAMSLVRGQYMYGNTIIRQGMPLRSLIFLTKGQAKVTMDPMQLIQQYPNQCSDNDLQNAQRPRTFREGRRSFSGDLRRKSQTNILQQRRRESLDNRETYRKFVDVCLVGPPDCIGDFEVLLKLPTYCQTVTCMETVTTFELDLNNFYRLITKRNPQTYQHMHEVAEAKLSSRVHRFEDEEVHNPVLQHILDKIVRINTPFKQRQGDGIDVDPKQQPRWQNYREKQRQFLRIRQRERKVKEKQMSKVVGNHQNELERQMRNLALFETAHTYSAVLDDDDDEILPVISPDSRININPASGLVRLPRKMYRATKTPTSNRTSNPPLSTSRYFSTQSLIIPNDSIVRRLSTPTTLSNCNIGTSANSTKLSKSLDAPCRRASIPRLGRKFSMPTVGYHDSWNVGGNTRFNPLVPIPSSAKDRNTRGKTL